MGNTFFKRHEPIFFFWKQEGKEHLLRNTVQNIFAYDKYIKLNDFVDIDRKIMQFGKYSKIK